MIHALLTDGRTILIGENEPVQTQPDPLRADSEPLYNRFAWELFTITGRRQLVVRIDFRGPWWPIARLRRIDDPQP